MNKQLSKNGLPINSLTHFTFCLFIISYLLFAVNNTLAIDWTVMVYMCGDNSMNEQSYEDLEEMMEIGSSEKVKVVVQIDNIASSIEPNCRRYLISSGHKELLADLGEIDMADPQSLIDFAHFINAYYNANKYLLILWDHGNGWPIGQYGVAGEKGIIYDQSSNNWIGIADGELQSAIAETKKILRKNVSILAFDACLMGMAEVASEVADCSEIMFASEEVTPWDGLPYNDLLSILTTQPNISPSALAKKMVEVTSNSYNNGSQGFEPCTFSAIDLKQFTKAQKNFTVTSNIIASYANSPEIKQARNTVQTFSIESSLNPPPTYQDDYIDLLDFLEKAKKIINNQNDQQKIQKTIDLFNNAILEKRNVGSYLNNAKGLSVWFPDNYIAFKQQLTDYKMLNWHEKVPWLSLLNNYYASDDIKPSSVILNKIQTGSKNDFNLCWSKGIDLAPVRYNIIETKNITPIFSDNCDTMQDWLTQGFSQATQHYYSQFKSYHSGSGNNLNNQLTLQDSKSIPDGGLLSFQTYYSTEEKYLLSGKIKRDVFYVEISDRNNIFQILDSFYGSHKIWTEHRYLLPSTQNLKLRFRYKTDESNADIGVFIDDITINRLFSTREIASNYPDTVYYIFNIPQGIYYYLISPVDSFYNKGFVSVASMIDIKNYCEPFSLPSPFLNDCKIFCDYPQQEKPDLYIYTLSGALVTKISNQTFANDTAYWNGKNKHGQDVASGLYLTLLKSDNFVKIGKIAKVK